MEYWCFNDIGSHDEASSHDDLKVTLNPSKAVDGAQRGEGEVRRVEWIIMADVSLKDSS